MPKRKTPKKYINQALSMNDPEFDVTPLDNANGDFDITHEFILEGLKKIYSDLENEAVLKDMLVDIANETLQNSKGDIKKMITMCGSLWIKNRQEKADVLTRMTNHLAKWGEEINRERVLIKKMTNNELYKEYRAVKLEVDKIIEKYRSTEWTDK